jgi:hypothetical protein
MEWKYEQCFGKGPTEEVLEGDAITAVDYDTTGQLLSFAQGCFGPERRALARKLRAAF